MSALAEAARSLRDIGQLRLRVWAPSAELRERLSKRGSILVAGHEVPYHSFIACSFDPSDPPLVEQLALTQKQVA